MQECCKTFSRMPSTLCHERRCLQDVEKSFHRFFHGFRSATNINLCCDLAAKKFCCTGVQQGDPLGPFFVQFGSSRLVNLIKEKFPHLIFQGWYLDDGTIYTDYQTSERQMGHT